MQTQEGGELIVAVPLGDTNATLDRLALIELVVGAVILVALGLAAWWLVGVGLRPLRRMGEVAGQIADGDLSRRVEPDDDRTEVGRLGAKHIDFTSGTATLVLHKTARKTGKPRMLFFTAEGWTC